MQDKPNCTSVGMLGVGGFCTGKVVSMGNTAKLHPTGQSFLGYPCIGECCSPATRHAAVLCMCKSNVQVQELSQGVAAQGIITGLAVTCSSSIAAK